MFVRLALEDEREIFVELARMAVAESASHIPFEAEVVRATFQRYLDKASPTIFIVDDRRDAVGFLMATISGYTFSSGLYVTQEVLFVRPDRRGTRAAMLLTKELVQWAERLGALEITGGNDNNLFSERTAGLLEKFGFERVGIFMRRLRGAAHG